MSSTATKSDEKTKDKPKDEKSEHLKELEQQLADLENADDGVEAEAVPADTEAELERVKQVIGHQFGIDMRSPGQIKQAEIDGIQAEIDLAEQQAEESKKAEEEAQAVAEPAAEPVAAGSKPK